ncbi:MAG: hypothetical protein CL942_16205 [Desulfovibrio sp.]|nr:hypothetical protein [Desulfovibrio sp.]
MLEADAGIMRSDIFPLSVTVIEILLWRNIVQFVLGFVVSCFLKRARHMPRGEEKNVGFYCC